MKQGEQILAQQRDAQRVQQMRDEMDRQIREQEKLLEEIAQREEQERLILEEEVKQAINTKMANIRQILSNIEDGRRKIVDWMVENDLTKNKKNLNALIFRVFPSKGKSVQMHLKSMSEECSQLDPLMKEIQTFIKNRSISASKRPPISSMKSPSSEERL
ncbi:hypothetical protein PMAYCL1PPCAC_20395, partial [Pristionchus mayeri]